LTTNNININNSLVPGTNKEYHRGIKSYTLNLKSFQTKF
jgi:hypothetical protein